MVQVNFNTSDFRRRVADEGALMLKNRYFEQNPFLTEDGSALIARPGMRRLTYIGSGPIRGLHSEAGAFNGDLFVASGAELYRTDNLLDDTFIYGGLNNPEKGFVNMAITAQIGDVPEYLFVADGRDLLVYIANGYARNTLTGTPANTDQVRIDNIYYAFTSGSVDTGTPDGSSGNPWLVALGSNSTEAFTNLYDAINASGIAGLQYSTNLEEHPTVEASTHTSTTMSARAKVVGAVGNSIITTETGTSLAWAEGGTMVDGGTPTISQVQMPEDVGVIDVAVINSFVIVIPAQVDGFQGRFYWIEPGEITVDPLNFATAERSPDGVYGVEVFGDQFWLPGESTTEVWYVSSDPNNRMQRLQGVVFDRGSWQNTAQAVHETLVVVDGDGGVFLIQGGSPKRVSTPDIEEQIRNAISLQQGYLY
jgi:hypothetical protein